MSVEAIDPLLRLRAELSMDNFPLSDDLPRIACDALVAGLDTPTLRELAGVTQREAHNSLVDCRALLLRALEELGLDPIPEDEARRQLAQLVSHDILDRRIDPFDGARRIGYELFLEFQYPDVENQISCSWRGLDSEAECYPEGRLALAEQVRHIARIILSQEPNDISPDVGRPLSVGPSIEQRARSVDARTSRLRRRRA